MRSLIISCILFSTFLLTFPAGAQIGRRFPSEKKVVTDPLTGVQQTFLTSSQLGNSKIYDTQRQWTADGKWLVFRSRRVPGETLAVNEESGDIVQVTEGAYMGVQTLASKSMKLYFMRMNLRQVGQTKPGPVQIVEVDLDGLFADSESGQLKAENEYQRVCGTIPAEVGAGGSMALDAGEDWVYYRIGKAEAERRIASGMKIDANIGPGNMEEGPSGIGKMNIKTGETGLVVILPFQVGTIQANPSVPGEIVFCRESGDRAPRRSWTVMSDGSGLRPQGAGHGVQGTGRRAQ